MHMTNVPTCGVYTPGSQPHPGYHWSNGNKHARPRQRAQKIHVRRSDSSYHTVGAVWRSTFYRDIYICRGRWRERDIYILVRWFYHSWHSHIKDTNSIASCRLDHIQNTLGIGHPWRVRCIQEYSLHLRTICPSGSYHFLLQTQRYSTVLRAQDIR